MKKLLVSVLILTIITTLTQAQNTAETFGKGDNIVGVGFGVGGVYGFSKYSSQSPVIGMQYDRGIIELGMGGVIGVGGFVGYKSIVRKNSYWYGSYKEKWNIIVIGARGTFHYDLFKVENLDTYGGAMVAYHIINYTNDFDDNTLVTPVDTHNDAAFASLFAGAKYYFSPAVGAYAEVGYGVSWLTMGIAFKF